MEGFTGVNYAFANAGITESTVSRKLKCYIANGSRHTKSVFLECTNDHFTERASGELRGHESPSKGFAGWPQTTEQFLVQILVPYWGWHHGSPPVLQLLPKLPTQGQ
jgi:hypothetical protein